MVVDKNKSYLYNRALLLIVNLILRPTVATLPYNWYRESISWTRCQDLDTPQWANIYFLRTFIVVLHNLNIVMGVGERGGQPSRWANLLN